MRKVNSSNPRQPARARKIICFAPNRSVARRARVIVVVEVEEPAALSDYANIGHKWIQRKTECEAKATLRRTIEAIGDHVGVYRTESVNIDHVISHTCVTRYVRLRQKRDDFSAGLTARL